MLPQDPPSRNHRHFTVRLPCWPHSDLNVLSQGSEELHEALDREDAGAVSHQGRDVGLLDPKNLARFGLRNATPLDEAVNLQREFGFQQFLLRMWPAEIGKHVPAASLHRFPPCTSVPSVVSL